MTKLHPTRLALIISAACATPSLWAQNANLDTVTVEARPGGTSSGLIVQEEAPKARSSVNRAAMDSMQALGNPFQAVELLPGVNTFSQDGTGLFGGGIRVRGFAGDQMGFTINGAPANDSGNFAVFPQEYTEAENLCEVFVTQGSADNEAPHVGASGGNFGMVTCAPNNKFRFRAQQTVGELNSYKTFLRVDTGKFANDMAKAFVSISKAEADKFKGPGKAVKEHLDAVIDFRPTNDLFFNSSFLYNYQLNNNFRTLTATQIAANPKLDFSSTVPVHTPGVNGTAQTEVLPADGYYGFNQNPFKNIMWTGKAEYTISPTTRVVAEPYYWYGFGTGGSQLKTLRESKATNILGGGVADINKDGDALDTVMIYNSSMTRTHRPGITVRAFLQRDNHNIQIGAWYERASHRQYGPGQTINDSGQTSDVFLDTSSNFLLRQDGTQYQSRDWLTINKASNIFAQDSISLMDDKLLVQPGIRRAEIVRDFTNYANNGSTSATGRSDGTYNIVANYNKVLPSLNVKYALSKEKSVFGSVTQSMRAPSNFVLSNLLQGGTVVNGVLTGATLRQPVVGMETSTNYDFGFRYFTKELTLSATAFVVDYRDRIASSYDPVNLITTDYNVGNVLTKGVEVEAGFKASSAWTLYSSLSYNDTRMKDDLKTSATNIEKTGGKVMPDAPNWMAGFSANYASGQWFGNLQAKYTGRAFSTLVNDEFMKDYVTVNAAIGFNFESSTQFKNPSIRLNVSNLLNTDFVRISSPSGSSFTVRALGTGGSSPSYYVGAPRFFGVTLRSDF